MACASGAAAVALGADLISDGVVDTALVGGVDALTRICFMGFNALKLLDPDPCRPFDRERRGMFEANDWYAAIFAVPSIDLSATLPV